MNAPPADTLESAPRPARDGLAPAPRPAVPSQLDSRALFGPGDEVQIAHGGEVYRLRRTRQDKLILTK